MKISIICSLAVVFAFTVSRANPAYYTCKDASDAYLGVSNELDAARRDLGNGSDSDSGERINRVRRLSIALELLKKTYQTNSCTIETPSKIIQ